MAATNKQINTQTNELEKIRTPSWVLTKHVNSVTLQTLGKRQSKINTLTNNFFSNFDYLLQNILAFF